QIIVERLDDKVAIVIGRGPVVIMLEAVALGKAGEIEPVPGPAFAVVGAGQRAADQVFVSRRGGVIQEALDILWRRRQAEQIEVNPANKLAAIHQRIRRNARRLLLDSNEVVDWGAAPGGIFDFRRFNSL